MKKIFTLMAAAVCATSAWTADFQLFHEGTPLENGATYQVGYTASVTEIPGVMTIYKVMRDAALFLQADPEIELTVEVRASETGTQFCAFDGSCLSNNTPGQLLSKTGNMTTAQPSDLRIDQINNSYDAYDYFTGTNTVKVTVYTTENPDEAVTVTVEMLPVPQEEVGSLQKVEMDSAEVGAEYYDLQGRRVANPDHGIYVRRVGGSTTKVAR